MNIPVNTTTSKFFRQLLAVMSNISPIKGLRPRELDVLAEILTQNYRLREVADDLRPIVVFSTENRKLMCSNLSISEDTLNNNLSVLRKSGILSKANHISGFLNIIPGDTFIFAVTFKIEDDVDR